MMEKLMTAISTQFLEHRRHDTEKTTEEKFLPPDDHAGGGSGCCGLVGDMCSLISALPVCVCFFNRLTEICSQRLYKHCQLKVPLKTY